MLEENKWVEAVSKLIQLTQQGQLDWNVVRSGESMIPNEEGVRLAFVTVYQERLLRIYSKTVEGSSLPVQMLSVSSTGVDVRPQEIDRVVLEIIDDEGNSLWQFPYTDALDDLYKAVRYQAAEVDELLDDLLEGE